MIVWDEVTKIFSSDLLTKPVVALDKISFQVHPGSMTGFLGANGAGKTTSLKVALGFTSASSGEVRFSEVLGKNHKEAFARIGFLPERPYFYPHLTGEEFSTYMGRLSGMSRLTLRQRQIHLAERLGIAAAFKRPLRTYSKGMLQRLGFLVAIQHDPLLVILDEPLSGLDPVGRKELKDIMADVHQEGKTVFYSTHIVSDVEEKCDQVVFMRQGALVYAGGVKELLDRNPARYLRLSVEAPEKTQWHTPLIASQFHNGIWTIKVDISLKNQLITETVSLGGSINSLTPEGSSLEDIFYGIGQ